MTVTKYHEGGFPPDKLDWDRLVPCIGPANAAVARYDGMLAAIPNAHVLLSPLTTQEAVLSSRIEGTQATMGEVLEYEACGGTDEPSSPKEADIWEVLNYRKAMWTATEMLNDLPLCQRIVLESHKILLNSVRGHGKAPGRYREIPNWIGPQGCSIEEARFVPISADRLPEAMSRWEKYIHDKSAPAGPVGTAPCGIRGPASLPGRQRSFGADADSPVLVSGRAYQRADVLYQRLSGKPSR